MKLCALAVRAIWAVLAAGCGDQLSAPLPPPPYVEVAAIATTPNRAVDLLFVIDDTADLFDQAVLRSAITPFLGTLARLEGGLPDLHIGVVTTDLGTTAESTPPGANVGIGPGSCAGVGKDGALQTNVSTLVSGRYIIDTRNDDGSRTTNYTNDLQYAMAQVLTVGAGGCGFEQPLRAIRRAAENPYNEGFLRPDASLAIVILTDEDDCSVRDAALLDRERTDLGSLQSFRCTRFGVTCDEGGTTPDEMNVLGAKGACHSNEQSPYLVAVADQVEAIRALKPDPYRVLVATIAAAPEPLVVEGRQPPGGGTTMPALAHTCAAISFDNSLNVADPAVRLEEATRQFARHLFFPGVCTNDHDAAMSGVARQIRQMTGERCLHVPAATVEDCVAFDVHDGTEAEILPCSENLATNCYRIVEDATRCDAIDHLALEVIRASEPPTGTTVSLRCR